MNKGRWKLTGKRYDFIKEVVCDLFIRYKVKCIPVSGFEIASKMGVSLVAYSGLSEKKRGVVLGLSKDGFVYINKNRTYIYYNDMRISYERQNWTVLHEIGHIVLNHMGNNAQEEYEADFFAKYTELSLNRFGIFMSILILVLRQQSMPITTTKHGGGDTKAYMCWLLMKNECWLIK